MKRMRVVIEGRVQGVFFRASLQLKARSLGFSGWVRNLPDGKVEALIEGKEANLSAMLDWCNNGPPRAIVEKVAISEEPYSGDFTDFTIRY